MNTIMTSIMLASLCVTSCYVLGQQKSKSKQSSQELAGTMITAITAPADQGVSKPLSEAEIKLQADASRLAAIIQEQTDIIEKPKTPLVPELSVGARVDGWWTKLTDNIWGHASTVIEDVNSGRITNGAVTDGLHRIDRAIDEHIAGDNQSGLRNLIIACTKKKILIPVAHIQKAQKYFAELQQETSKIEILLGAMQQLQINAMQQNSQHIDSKEPEKK